MHTPTCSIAAICDEELLYPVVNMVGGRIVRRAIELGMVHEGAVVRIEGAHTP